MIPYLKTNTKLKKSIKKILCTLYLSGFQVGIKTIVLDAVRKLKKTDKKIIDDYLGRNQVRKLHIGCGGNIFSGWLNTNYITRSKEILCFDATNTYPFNDNEFDYIFSEHMIEHVTYQQGQKMISECFRVLRPKGKLRISTPDLSFLIDLYSRDKSILQKEFIRHSTDKWLEYAPTYDDTFVINNYVRAWGHQFIYDEKVLSYLFEKEGFVNITRFNVSESQDEEMQNLENVSRKPEGLIALESFVLEGTKP